MTAFCGRKQLPEYYEFKADIPGQSKDKISITVDGHRLHIAVVSVFSTRVLDKVSTNACIFPTMALPYQPWNNAAAAAAAAAAINMLLMHAVTPSAAAAVSSQAHRHSQSMLQTRSLWT